MRRNRFLALIIIAMGITFSTTVSGASPSANQAIDDANAFLKEKMGFSEYYKLTSNGKELNDNLAASGTPTLGGKPIFVYGSTHDASVEATTGGYSGRYFDTIDGKVEFRAFGYARNGSPFPNPVFTPDNEGYKADDKKWIKEPWGISGNRKLQGEDGKIYTRYMSTSQYGGLDYINKWIGNSFYRFSADSVESHTGRRDFFTQNALEVPDVLKGQFEDFLYVIQPPTEHAWGLGIAFYYWDNYNRLNYRTFLLKPFSLTANDLSVYFSPHSSGAQVGNPVLIGVEVESTFKDTKWEDIPFEWSIRTAAGDSIEVTYEGASSDPAGNFLEEPKSSERTLYARFTMPSDDVRISFAVNKAGDKPKESYLENNTIETFLRGVSSIKSVGEYDLDYNVLTRHVDFPLSPSEIVAQLYLPKGSWSGNASGSLGVTNGEPTLFRNFQVHNNPTVNEAASRIVRFPDISTQLQRTDFGDDPAGGNWLNPGNPAEPVDRTGNISFNGSVTRPYTYSYPVCSLLGCYTVTENSSTSADFNSGTNQKTIRTFVYNGMPTIAPKVFKNQIDSNVEDSLQKSLFWTSETYPIRVIRWMYHMNSGGTLENGMPIDGQYVRSFRQQNTGKVTWSIASSMEEDYRPSREAAGSRDYDKTEYDKAVFASDADFKSVDYPIKSGYYFNPTGEYTFDVETVTFKPTSADTQDHQDLVDAVIKAFRYESDLIYINNAKQAVNLRNEALSKKGSGFERKSAYLTAENPTGVDGAVLLQVLDRNVEASRFAKSVEELPHTQDDSGTTHPFLKEIMEGYSQSGTHGSKDNYKYAEYVKNGQRMYKITEKTTVTIKVNPTNRKVYTHVQMGNGDYTVKAWFDDIALSSIAREYKKLGTLKGVSTLDEITVTVKGSMYDDVN
jgi:hypothetical protein